MLEHNILLLLLISMAIFGAIGMVLKRKPGYLKPLLFMIVTTISGMIAYGVITGYGSRVPQFFKDAKEQLEPLSGPYESLAATEIKDSPAMILPLEAGGGMPSSSNIPAAQEQDLMR